MMMKLSKGVLGLKFMRKTREQIIKEDAEKRYLEHCKVDVKSQSSSSLIQIKTEPGSQSQLNSIDCKVIVCPSYLHCERFNYARQSYGGMNPHVEENIRKGHWSMEYEVTGAEGEEIPVQVKDELMDDADDFEDGEIGLDKNMNSDEEDKNAIEGSIYGSIIATIGKKFNKNWKQKKTEQPESEKQRNRKRAHQDPLDRHDQAVIPHKQRKKGFGGRISKTTRTKINNNCS